MTAKTDASAAATPAPWIWPVLILPLHISYRIYMANRMPIMDCDETFNYWEVPRVHRNSAIRVAAYFFLIDAINRVRQAATGSSDLDHWIRGIAQSPTFRYLFLPYAYRPSQPAYTVYLERLFFFYRPQNFLLDAVSGDLIGAVRVSLSGETSKTLSVVSLHE